jgi:hypothetical protein
MGAYETNSIDQFLKHKSNAGGAGFLKKWTDRNPAEINTVLHTKRMPIVLWQHPFPRIMIREDKKTRQATREVWGGNYNCLEDEAILRKQYHRNDDGTRKYTPVKCPICRMVEYVRDMVEEDRLDWLTPIFRFNGDKDDRVIHAGGLFGAFKSDDLTDDEIRQIKSIGLKMNETYQENAYAKCNYVFCVVDVDNIQDGVQIATVTNLLGDKVKEVINDKMKSAGSEAGNPFLVPYCIQWEYLKNETDIKKRYKARPMERIQITPAIQELIRSDPPDLSNVIAPFELKTMRSFLERYCLINDKMDWDYIFKVKVDEDEQKNARVVGELRGGEEDPVDPPVTSGQAPPVGAAPTVQVDDDTCPVCHKTEAQGCPHAMCDCGQIILASDPKCPHCDKVFAPTPPPPPTTSRKRRGARGGTDSGEKPPFA